MKYDIYKFSNNFYPISKNIVTSNFKRYIFLLENIKLNSYIIINQSISLFFKEEFQK